MSKNDGGPAYPNRQASAYDIHCDCGKVHRFDDVTHPGISLRDYFAAKAMQGMCSIVGRRKHTSWIRRLMGHPEQTDIFLGDCTSIAIASYKQADAMLAEKVKESPNGAE